MPTTEKGNNMKQKDRLRKCVPVLYSYNFK